jgi:lipoyl(octanoyl) transferase
MFEWLGTIEYGAALERQHQAWNSGHAKVFGLEHPSVITLGKRGNPDADLRSTNEIEVFTTDRGGQATLHSPGQLVIYPILPIREWELGVREFVELLQTTTRQTLKSYGVEAFEKCALPGLFTAHGKIAFTGIRIEKGISRHGISINISNDLGLFSNIRSCGMNDARLDKLNNYCDVSLEQFFRSWSERFQNNLATRQ